MNQRPLRISNTLHWSPFPTTPTYIVGCPTRPGEPACSRAANHPFLSEQAFRSGRREGQELGSVIRVCSLLTALLTHLRKDRKNILTLSHFWEYEMPNPASSPYFHPTINTWARHTQNRQKPKKTHKHSFSFVCKNSRGTPEVLKQRWKIDILCCQSRSNW